MTPFVIGCLAQLFQKMGHGAHNIGKNGWFGSYLCNEIDTWSFIIIFESRESNCSHILISHAFSNKCESHIEQNSAQFITAIDLPTVLNKHQCEMAQAVSSLLSTIWVAATPQQNVSRQPPIRLQDSRSQPPAPLPPHRSFVNLRATCAVHLGSQK